MDFTANEGSGESWTGGSNPPVSAHCEKPGNLEFPGFFRVRADEPSDGRGLPL